MAVKDQRAEKCKQALNIRQPWNHTEYGWNKNPIKYLHLINIIFLDMFNFLCIFYESILPIKS